MKTSGSRRDLVTIQQKSVTKNDIGEEVASWADVETRRASVSPIRGREFFAAQQTQSGVDYRVNLLKPVTLTQDMRLVHNGQALDIVSIIDNVRELEVMCSTGVRNAI